MNGCADHLTWSSVCHHDGVGVLCAGSGSRLAIAPCDLEVGFEGNVVTIRRSVITRIGSVIPFGAFMLALIREVALVGHSQVLNPHFDN